MERNSSDEQPTPQWQKMSATKDGVNIFYLNLIDIVPEFQIHIAFKDIWQNGIAISQDHGMETSV